jgi:tetratricopeptide (TPR) repeat protein
VASKPRAGAAPVAPSDPPEAQPGLEAFAAARPADHPALDAIRRRQGLATEDPRTWAWTDGLDPEIPVPVPGPPDSTTDREEAKLPARPEPPDLAYGTKSTGGRALVDDARALERSGQMDDAVEAYATAATLFQMDAELERALRTYRHALRLDPSRTDLADATVDLLIAEGRGNEAVELLSDVLLAVEASGERDAVRHLRARLDGLRLPSTPEIDEASRTDDIELTKARERGTTSPRQADEVVATRIPDDVTEVERPPLDDLTSEDVAEAERAFAALDTAVGPTPPDDDGAAEVTAPVEVIPSRPPAVDESPEATPVRFPDEAILADLAAESTPAGLDPEPTPDVDAESEAPPVAAPRETPPIPAARTDVDPRTGAEPRPDPTDESQPAISTLEVPDEPIFDPDVTPPPPDPDGPDEPTDDIAQTGTLAVPGSLRTPSPLERPAWVTPPRPLPAERPAWVTPPGPLPAEPSAGSPGRRADAEASDDGLRLDVESDDAWAPSDTPYIDAPFEDASEVVAPDDEDEEILSSPRERASDVPPEPDAPSEVEAETVWSGLTLRDSEVLPALSPLVESPATELESAPPLEGGDPEPAGVDALESDDVVRPEAPAPEVALSPEEPESTPEPGSAFELEGSPEEPESTPEPGSAFEREGSPEEPETAPEPGSAFEREGSPAEPETAPEPGSAFELEGPSLPFEGAPQTAAATLESESGVDQAEVAAAPPAARAALADSDPVDLDPVHLGLPPIPAAFSAPPPGAQPFDLWLETDTAQAVASEPVDAPELESLPPLSVAPVAETTWARPERPALAFRGLDAAEGRIEHPADAVDLLIALDRERCVGVLEADGVSPIVFVDGQARDLRGEEAFEAALWGWTAPRGATEPEARRDGRDGLRRALRRHARTYGLTRQACDLATIQAISQTMVQLLLLDGDWRFVEAEPPIRADDVLPAALETPELLVGWVAQAWPTEELVGAIGGSKVRLKVSTRAPVPRQADLRRFFRALDGQRTFEQARREAHVAPARAAAQAAVWVWSGWTGPTRPPEPVEPPPPAPAPAPLSPPPGPWPYPPPMWMPWPAGAIPAWPGAAVPSAASAPTAYPTPSF